jgi:hypothetical protein
LRRIAVGIKPLKVRKALGPSQPLVRFEKRFRPPTNRAEVLELDGTSVSKEESAGFDADEVS